MSEIDLTAQRLRELLDYDPETGAFTWRNPGVGRRRSTVAGHTDKTRGERSIRLDGRLYKAHRLAWLHVYGSWPSNEIDHIDLDPSNNRLSNLRDATRRTNQQNFRLAQSNNLLGVRGVNSHQGGFRVRIFSKGKQLTIGVFKTIDEASAAYIQAKRQLHEGCTI